MRSIMFSDWHPGFDDNFHPLPTGTDRRVASAFDEGLGSEAVLVALSPTALLFSVNLGRRERGSVTYLAALPQE